MFTLSKKMLFLRRALLAPARGRRGLVALPSNSPWSVLGVSPDDDINACKAAFRKLALAMHPDVTSDPVDAERFAAVVEAYEAIASGEAESARPRRTGPRGVRVVGGVLVISIDILKQDPSYQVHTIRLRLDSDRSSSDDGIPSSSSSSSSSSSGCSSGCGREEGVSATSTALSTGIVHDVHSSAFDSVADLRMQLQEEFQLPEALRHSLRHSGGHELIYRSQLLGEHLFLIDYGISDGDTLHFAVRKRGRGAA